jgi:hypothetical protein
MGATFVGAEHDDALYILGSQALAFGNYTQWFLPGTPRFTNGPPGLPALLLPVGFFAPENLLLYQLMMAAVASLSVFFFWKATHRYFSEITATTLTAFFAANPVFLYRSGMVMPEIPALAVGLYLWWKQDRLSGWSIGAWLLAAYLIRPASVALWGAVWGTLLIQRQWKKGAFSLVLPLAGLALWSAWCHGYGGLQENKELAVFYKGTGGFLATALTVAAHNGKEILLITGQSFLPIFLARDVVALGWGAVLWGTALAGLFRSRTRVFPVLWAASYLLMHLFWPYWYNRYYILLFPMLLVGVAFALIGNHQTSACPAGLTSSETPKTANRWRTKAMGGVVTALFLAVFLGHSVRWFQPSPERPTRPLHEWVKTNVPPHALCASLFYGTDILYTGRLFSPLWNETDADPFHTQAKKRKVQFILWDNTPAGLGHSTPGTPVDLWRANVARWLTDPTRYRPLFTTPAGSIFTVL